MKLYLLLLLVPVCLGKAPSCCMSRQSTFDTFTVASTIDSTSNGLQSYEVNTLRKNSLHFAFAMIATFKIDKNALSMNTKRGIRVSGQGRAYISTPSLGHWFYSWVLFWWHQCSKHRQNLLEISILNVFSLAWPWPFLYLASSVVRNLNISVSNVFSGASPWTFLYLTSSVVHDPDHFRI